MDNKKIELSQAHCTGLSFSAPVLFAAEGREPDSPDFEMEAYTGKPVARWWGTLAIDVAGIQSSEKMPILQNHDHNKIVGFSTGTRKDSSFWVSGRFSGTTPAAKEVEGLAKEGFPWQASIGVRPLSILDIKEGSTYNFGGEDIHGPAEIWLKSEVKETSFLPFGADDNTSVSMFSRVDEIKQPEVVNMAEEKKVAVTVESLKADHPEIVAEMQKEAAKAGAKVELARIQGVQAQSMAGHEDLVSGLMFDGVTTGPEAAVQILNAEKQTRKETLDNLKDDAPDPVKHAGEGQPKAKPDNSKLPFDERCKAEWDESGELRDEFGGDFEAFTAYSANVEAGNVKVLGGIKS